MIDVVILLLIYSFPIILRLILKILIMVVSLNPFDPLFSLRKIP